MISSMSGNGGQPTPEVTQGAAQKLQEQGFSLESAMQKVSQMDGWSQLALFLGLGLGAIGLVNSFSEGGGISDMMLAAAGLGIGGGVAASNGVFGQQAQQGMNGFLDNLGLNPKTIGDRIAKGEAERQFNQDPRARWLRWGTKLPVVGGWVRNAAKPYVRQQIANNPAAAGREDMLTEHLLTQ